MKKKLYIAPSFESNHLQTFHLCSLSQTGAEGLDPTSESDEGEYEDEDDVGVKEHYEEPENPYGLW